MKIEDLIYLDKIEEIKKTLYKACPELSNELGYVSLQKQFWTEIWTIGDVTVNFPNYTDYTICLIEFFIPPNKMSLTWSIGIDKNGDNVIIDTSFRLKFTAKTLHSFPEACLYINTIIEDAQLALESVK